MTDTADKDFWKPFGESTWREFAATVQASDLQLRFSVARFNGASAAAAAKIAGYSGDHASIRRAGYAAVRSSAVVALLDLAAINAPAESRLTDAEVDSRLAKLVRSPDPLIMLKATELYDKRKQRAKEAGETPEDDGFSEWRVERDFLLLPNGAVAYLLTHLDKRLMGNVGNLCLLHDTYSLLMQQKFGPELWAECRARLSGEMLKRLDGFMADPKYQLEARIKIWKEIGVDLSKVINAA